MSDDDLDALRLAHTDEQHGLLECIGYSEGQACCIDAIRPNLEALIQRLRAAEDRLAILGDPGTLEAITQGMWDYAESKGHPKASSSHAYGFLMDLIERLERERNVFALACKAFVEAYPWWDEAIESPAVKEAIALAAVEEPKTNST